MENDYGISQRQGFIVWFNDIRQARQLERYGNLHYVSKKMQYAVVYVQSERADEMARQMQKLNGVKKVERSYRSEIWELYTNSGNQQTVLKSPDSSEITPPEVTSENPIES